MRQIKQFFHFKPFSQKQRKVLNWWCESSPVKDYDGIIADTQDSQQFFLQTLVPYRNDLIGWNDRVIITAALPVIPYVDPSHSRI